MQTQPGFSVGAAFLFVYFAAFGLLTVVGGLMGYLKAKSVASLVAGGISGGLLLVGAMLVHSGHLTGGATLLLIVSLLLLGRFAPALLRGKLNPAVYVAPLALIGVALAVLALVGAR